MHSNCKAQLRTVLGEEKVQYKFYGSAWIFPTLSENLLQQCQQDGHKHNFPLANHPMSQVKSCEQCRKKRAVPKEQREAIWLGFYPVVVWRLQRVTLVSSRWSWKKWVWFDENLLMQNNQVRILHREFSFAQEYHTFLCRNGPFRHHEM